MTEGKKEKRLKDLQDSRISEEREWLHLSAADLIQRKLRIPGESDVLEALLQADKPEAVREICLDAPNWPISTKSGLTLVLSQHAEQFVAARSD